MTVRECQARMSAREFMEWQIYDRIEPFGEHRADWRTAMLCCTIVSCLRAFAGGKGRTPKVEDYLLRFGQREPMTTDAMRTVMFGAMARQQGTTISNGEARIQTGDSDKRQRNGATEKSR